MNIEEKRIVAKPTEALENIPLDESNPERCTRVGVDLEEKNKKDLIHFLKKNTDVYAGYRSSVITHRLNVCPSFKPVRKKKRVFAPERDNAIKDEVQKLMAAKFIRDVYYPDWLANVVMIKKANGK